MKKLCFVDKEKLVDEILDLVCVTACCNNTKVKSNREYYKRDMTRAYNKILRSLGIHKNKMPVSFSDTDILKNKSERK